MPKIDEYLEYLDPNVGIWRKGTPDDPYVARTDSLPVVNNVITLLEIPSDTHRVQISGFTEITQDQFRKKKYIAENEFYVDYANGIIQFNPLNEGKTFTHSFYGKGLMVIPASRVYAMIQRNPDIVVTLQDYVDDLNLKLSQINLRLTEISRAIFDANEATAHANLATDNANLAADNANNAADEARNAAESSIVIYKEPIDSFDDIDDIYPNPENGWRTMDLSTGDIYRYDGIYTGQWTLIGNWTGGLIPFVSESTSGILKSEDFLDFQVKTMVFMESNISSFGAQNSMGAFSFDGEIESVTSFCRVPSTSTIEFSIDKKDINEPNTWNSIFSTNITFQDGELDGSTPVVNDATVLKGDRFRLYAHNVNDDIEGLVVQVNVRIKSN